MGDKTRKTLIDGKSWDEKCDLIIADEAIGRVSLVSADFQSIISRLGFDGTHLERNRVIEIGDMIAVKSEFPGGSVLDILLPRNQMSDFISILEESEYSGMSDDRWNFVRLAVCIPSLIDIKGNLPNECGMINRVSNDKGCYPGQEVHARLDSRGRTVKRLCLLTGETAISPGKYRLSNGSSALITSCESSESVSYGIAKLRVDDIDSGYVNLDGGNWKVESLTYL
jgi:folate-binding protein YgfZ